MVLTNTARNKIRDEIKTLFTYGGIGLDDTSPDANDTGLFGGGTAIDSCDATTGWTEEGDGGSVALNTESGEFKEGTGCLNLPISYSTGTAAWYKTISSTDFSEKKIRVWFYVTLITDLQEVDDTITLVLGTSGFTNSNEYTISRDEMANGWNSLLIDVDSPDNTTGTGATTSTIDRIKIQVKTQTTHSGHDLRLDYWRSYEAETLGVADSKNSLNQETGDYYFKTIHSISSVESNGLTIVEAGDSDNTDLLSRVTFAAIDKTNDTEIQIDKYYYIESS